jgi:hypothetical protein
VEHRSIAAVDDPAASTKVIEEIQRSRSEQGRRRINLP